MKRCKKREKKNNGRHPIGSVLFFFFCYGGAKRIKRASPGQKKKRIRSGSGADQERIRGRSKMASSFCIFVLIFFLHFAFPWAFLVFDGAISMAKQKKKKRKEKKRKEKEKPNSVNKNAGSFEVLQLDLIFSNKVNNWPCLEQKQKQLDGTSS